MKGLGVRDQSDLFIFESVVTSHELQFHNAS